SHHRGPAVGPLASPYARDVPALQCHGGHPGQPRRTPGRIRRGSDRPGTPHPHPVRLLRRHGCWLLGYRRQVPDKLGKLRGIPNDPAAIHTAGSFSVCPGNVERPGALESAGPFTPREYFPRGKPHVRYYYSEPPSWTVVTVTSGSSPPVRLPPSAVISSRSVPARVPVNVTVYGPPALPVTVTLPAPMLLNASNASSTADASAL